MSKGGGGETRYFDDGGIYNRQWDYCPVERSRSIESAGPSFCVCLQYVYEWWRPISLIGWEINTFRRVVLASAKYFGVSLLLPRDDGSYDSGIFISGEIKRLSLSFGSFPLVCICQNGKKRKVGTRRQKMSGTKGCGIEWSAAPRLSHQGHTFDSINCCIRTATATPFNPRTLWRQVLYCM